MGTTALAPDTAQSPEASAGPVLSWAAPFRRPLLYLPLILTWVATSAYAAAYAALAILRHESLASNALDLGYEDQALWNTIHGHPFQFTLLSGGGFSLNFQAPLGQAATSLLGYHAELLLAPLSLLYAVIPDVRALLAVQALVVCAGALAAFGLARRRLGNAWAGFFVALAYLSSPFVEAELLSDFHTVALNSALFLLVFYLIERRWLVPTLIVGALAAAAKEDAPVALTLLGFWALLVRRQRLAGLLLMAIGAAFSAFDFGWLIPHFAATKDSPFLERYGYLGASPLAMVMNVVRHPAILAPTLGSPESRAYLRALIGSSGALPVFAPLTLLIAGTSLAINLLATFPWMRSGMAHYSALVLPVLIAAALDGISFCARAADWIAARWRRTVREGIHAVSRRRRTGTGATILHPDAVANTGVRDAKAPPAPLIVALAAWLALGAIATHYQLGAGPGGRAWTLQRPDAHARLLSRFLAEIPPDAPVSTTSALAPHLTHRREIYLFPNVLDAQDILLDLTAAPYPLSWGDQRVRLLDLLRGGGFGVVDAADGYVLLRRGASVANLPPAAFSFTQGPAAALARRPEATFGGLSLLDATIRQSAVIGAGWQETLTMDWSVNQPQTNNAILAVWTNGTPRPVPPDFRDETPSLVWLPTSNWQPGQAVRIVTPPLAVKRPTALQVGWFLQDPPQAPIHWLPCVEAGGAPCPLGTHFVVLGRANRRPGL